MHVQAHVQQITQIIIQYKWDLLVLDLVCYVWENLMYSNDSQKIKKIKKEPENLATDFSSFQISDERKYMEMYMLN